MKELTQDMQLENLRLDMVNNVLEVTKSGLELKLDGECNFNLIYTLLEFSICFASYIMIYLKLYCLNQIPMFVGLITEPKHTRYGSTNSLGNLVCKTQIDNTPMSSPTTMFSCTKALL